MPLAVAPRLETVASMPQDAAVAADKTIVDAVVESVTLVDRVAHPRATVAAQAAVVVRLAVHHAVAAHASVCSACCDVVVDA